MLLFDSLVERVSAQVSAQLGPDVKPVVGAAGDTVATAAGDSVAQTAGQSVVTQSDTDVSATDEALIDVKPLITDPSLQSLAATLSTQTEDTDSGEPVMANIAAPLIGNNTVNHNRDEQSCDGTTPMDAIISNTDSQTITSHNDTITVEEVVIGEDNGVNSGQEFSAPAVDSADSDSTIIISDHNGEEVAKESVPAAIGLKRGRHSVGGHFRRRHKPLREYRGDDSNASDTTGHSGVDSGHPFAPFDGSLRDVSKRMASKTTGHSTTGRRSAATSITGAPDTSRSRSLTPRDGYESQHSVPPQSLLTVPLVSPFPVLSSANTHHSFSSATAGESPATTSSTATTSKTTTNASAHTVAYSEKRYKCDKCLQTYGRERHLKRHQKSQHGVREPYRCYGNGCERRYPTESRLAAHIRDKHRDRHY
ncbi:unnamed protein product, partial [Medioppia subpectinata]